MKDGFIAFSASGAVALFVGGVVLGWTLAHPDFIGFFLVVVSLLVVRQDALFDFSSGSYRRSGWGWMRVGSVANELQVRS